MEQTEEIVVMLEQITDPAFLVKDGIIVQVNPSASRFFIDTGRCVEELLATGALEYAQFRDGYLALTLKLNGQVYNASVTRLNDRDLFVLNHEGDQAELQSMALAAQELRNPLSTIMSVADRLFPLIGEQNDSVALEQIAKINRGLFQMLRIVSNMSDAYRYTQNSSTRFETRDICGIIDELITGIIPLMEYTGIQLRYDSPREPIFCLVDSEKLERAVHNIISNALKFTPAGGTIEARLTRRKNMLYLTVCNSDADVPGISPANFYRQYQRQPGLDDSRFGIGLGMVLIHGAATAHGGTVLLEKSPSGGTCITMSIALRQSTDPNVRASILHVDYAGERDHRLLELSDFLPATLYGIEKI
ncbi:MAG: HAMP domain-containing histidine kinase [Oscillospiraceae bacterium]|nr:HAMP domain-containing histidine kinase [Oscillospiraceae bacterium]